MGKELLGVICLMNNKGVLHIPKPDSDWDGEVLKVLASKSSINRLATTRHWRSHSSPLYLFIILNLKCEGTFEAEPKEGD